MSLDLPSLGWDGHFQALYRPYQRADLWPGRVSRVDRGICGVLGEAGPARVSMGGGLLACGARDRVGLPCPGDWVVVRRWPDHRTTIEAVLRRRTAIVWASADPNALDNQAAAHDPYDLFDATHATQQVVAANVVAANVDIAAILVPLRPAPGAGIVERLLEVAFASGARPLVLLTKTDLAISAAGTAKAIADLRAVAQGVEIWPVSARTEAGIWRVRAAVTPGTTMALIGPPGSGKSSLVGPLMGTPAMAMRQARCGRLRGGRTPATRALVALPGGGMVLDTSGFDAPELDASSLDATRSAAGSPTAGRFDITRSDAMRSDTSRTCRPGDSTHIADGYGGA